MTYHHGDLRRALLDAAAVEIAEHGPSEISLRAIARRAGVSHAAPAHHFGDRSGLLSAVAAEGFRRMDELMSEASEGAPDVLGAIGRAYIDFALANPGEFTVMFRPELLDQSDPDLVTHAGRAFQRLADAVATVPELGGEDGDPRVASARAWSLVHGLATLVLADSLPADDALIDAVIGSAVPRPR